jgi:hypothetical protein
VRLQKLRVSGTFDRKVGPDEIAIYLFLNRRQPVDNDGQWNGS